MDRHHYKYVVIDSSKHINQSVSADFTVQIPHGLNNCSRVCVKSFTMPNNFHNVYGNIKKVQWVEFWKPSAASPWQAQVFTATLNDGYFLTADLVSEIQTAMTSLDNRFPGETGDTLTSFSISHESTTLHNKILPNSSTKQKMFALYSDYENNVWRNLGFSNNKIIHTNEKIDDIITVLNGIADFTTFNDGVRHNQILLRKYHIVYALNNASYQLRSDLVGHNENHPAIYIASKKLGHDFYRSHKLDDYTVMANKEEYLALINIDVPKFSHIQYNTETPFWSSLEGKSISSFDIQILDYTGQIFPRESLADFIMVLQFEEVKEIEFSKEEKMAYLDYAYKLAH
tara:strand:+ start:34 stop:1062 length:1029 start_codon:yes stop_codon:yes gene_type:complete